MMDDDGDSGPFSLGQPLTDTNGYPVNTSIASQYHAWAAAAAASSSNASGGSSSTSGLPNHFSPVSPGGHGVVYSDHLGLHPSQAAVDVLSVRLGQGDYHTGQTDRLAQSDSYYSTGQADIVGRHGQADYHDHLGGQGDRHPLTVDVYHHVSASATSGQQQDRLGQADYHTTQQTDRLGQTDYHTGQQDRLGQTDYHTGSQQDRLGQLQDYHAGQADRMATLAKQDFHTAGQNDRMGGSQVGTNYHTGQGADRGLGGQADYHSTQVDLDAVGMHADFERRHLDVSMLPKDLVDSGQRGSAMDYLSGQASRDQLASIHRDIVGLQRELDLSVGQSVSPPQRGAGDLASSSYGLDPTTLPRDISPYSQRDLDRAVMSADVVVGQTSDNSGRGAGAGGGGVGVHPQDLSSLNLTATRDVIDMTALARQGGAREDLGRVRDVIHRPRDIQRALEVLGSLENATRSDLNGSDMSLNAGTSSKSASRAYPTTSRLLTTAKRQTIPSSSQAEIRTAALSAAAAAVSNSNAGVNFISMPLTRDPLSIMTSDPSSSSGCSTRLGSSADFSRQQATEMSRLRRELTAPYTDLSVHHSLLTSSAGVGGFKSGIDPLLAPQEQLVCNEVLTSSRERLYEMMKQHQFCDAILATTLHSVKVHKAVLCSASAYLCGVLSQTNMGKSGGQALTVQFKADIPAASLTAFIDFIYLGRVALSVKNARDLHVMARCLHMETLKKATEEILWASGLSCDSVPELLLLQQADKRDQACTAAFPVPVHAPPTREVGVTTDRSLADQWSVEASCQTEEPVPAVSHANCSLSSDVRGGASAVYLGGLGTLSLNVSGGGVSVGGGVGGSVVPVVNKNSYPPQDTSQLQLTTTTTTTATTTFSKPHSHHKKQLVSEASKPKPSSVTEQPTPDSFETESQTDTPSTSSTSGSGKPACSRPKKKAVASAAHPSPNSDFVYTTSPALPGQTLRPVYHSYGTRAAARTPTKLADSPSTQQQQQQASSKGQASKLSVKAKTEVAGAETGKTDADGDSETLAALQSQMAKHRGRMKKGRIAAAVLSEALRNGSAEASADSPAQVNTASSAAVTSENLAKSLDLTVLAPAQPPSSASSSAKTSTSTTAATTTSTLEQPPLSQTGPKGYRKRLIQSAVSESQRASQQLSAEKTAADTGTAASKAESNSSKSSKASTLCEEDAAILLQVSTVATASVDSCVSAAEIPAQNTESAAPAPTPKRKKKGKTRRMLLSSPGGSGGVRVRAPPKKRAKMELELEKLMREETEEEEEEEEALAGVPTISQAVAQAVALACGGTQAAGEQHTPTGKRIKLPCKPGKRARWIKNDQLSHIVVQLHLQAGEELQDGECQYTCRLCDNDFMLPKRCISHIMATHKVPETQVIENILVRKREGVRMDDESTVCDICGYRSRDGTTYYLHYHKYFKHGVPLPKGWTVFKCDLCGKELFTKFQLKDHKRTHLEKTPFVCEICGTGFQSRSCLHSHVFHRHKTERKHHCDRCDRNFKTRTQLSVHLRTHTGERPFSCPQCTYTSTTRGNIRLHLTNRHKLPRNDVETIMANLKPNCDTSVASLAWRMAEEQDTMTSDASAGRSSEDKAKKTKASKSGRKGGSGGGGRATGKGGKKAKEGEGTASKKRAVSPVFVTTDEKHGAMMMDASAMELFLKSATDPSMEMEDSANEDLAAKGEHGGFGKDCEDMVVGSSVMLTASAGDDGDGSGEGGGGGGSTGIELSAAEGFPSSEAITGEATTVTFLPPALETVFQQQQQQADPVSTATIIVPDTIVHTLQQQQQLQSHHKQHLYHHSQLQQPHHFTSFTVMGTTPTVQTLTPQDLVVSATTLNPSTMKANNMVDFGEMGVGMGIGDGLGDSTHRQGTLNSLDLTLQPTSGGSVSGTLPQQPGSPDPQQQSSVHLYMQHSPISPAPPISPNPVYVSVTPTPLTPTKPEGDPMQDQVASTSDVANAVVLDHSHQQQLQQHQYDATLLQAYYQQHFYSQNY